MSEIPDDLSADRPRTGLSAAAEAVAVVRSEERLQVGSEVRVSGRATLRKYVVTETVTQTFQVRREVVRLDHEPVSDGAAAVEGQAFLDDRVIEMVLHREVPTVTMRVVATERVRLHVDTVIERVPVSTDLRAERVDVDDSAAPSRR